MQTVCNRPNFGHQSDPIQGQGSGRKLPDRFGNMTLIRLPSRSPELNPVENVWQYLRQDWLSNRVFDTYDAIINAACQAWKNLTDRPETITSIGQRDWAHIGQR